MDFPGWDRDAFAAMEVAGFQQRMEAIRTRVRPKLQAIAEQLAPELSRRMGVPLHPHVAQHARRTVNPPEDTWCAWSPSRTGYKKHPHFQLGIRADHVYVQAGAITEAPFRAQLAQLLLEEGPALRASLPGDALWKEDHTSPDGVPTAALTDDDLHRLAGGLRRKSRGDFMVALHWPRDAALTLPPQAFVQQALEALERLRPVWELARRAAEQKKGAAPPGG